MGNWAFNWVQIVAHNKKPIAWRLGLLFAVIGYGLVDFDWAGLQGLLPQLVIASLAVTGFLAWISESLKTALLQLLLSTLVLLTTFGVMGWLEIAVHQASILAVLAVVMMVTSNLVHALNTLLREMARGLFQFDAVAEALKLNFQPIFLSNLTTALGFLFAGWLNPQMMEMGWIVAIGALVSLFLTMTLMPILLLSFLLEFRVGNTADRHGFRNLLEWLESKLHWRKALILVTALLTAVLLWASYKPLFNLPILLLLVVFGALFLLYWKSPRLVFFALWLAVTAWLISFQINQQLVFPLLEQLAYYAKSSAFDLEQSITVILMLSLGLIIDDAVHFFSRYHYAQQGVFRDSLSAVKFSMASVARPIWITSWLLAITMLILVFNSNLFIAAAALLTLSSIFVVTFMVLLWLPLVLTKKPEITND